MSNPPSAMGPPSVARTNTVAAHSAGPLGQSQTQTQGLKRAFDGMLSPVSCLFPLHLLSKKCQKTHAAVYLFPNRHHVVYDPICTGDGIMIVLLAQSSQHLQRSPT